MDKHRKYPVTFAPPCKKKLSPEARACPHCGHPLESEWAVKKRDIRHQRQIKTWLVILGGPILLLFIFGVVMPEASKFMEKLSAQTKDQQKVSIGKKQQVFKTMTRRRSTASRCLEQRHRDWSNQCSNVFGYADVHTPPEEVANKLTLSYDGERVRLTGLEPQWYYRKFYTGNPPVFAVIDKTPYVVDRYFFVEEIKAKIKVGGVIVTMQWDGAPQWVVAEAMTEKLLAAMRKGVIATIDYGADGRKTTAISILGFTAAEKALIHQSENQIVSRSPKPSAKATVVLHMGSNRFGVSKEDLRLLANPKGSGQFVYAPKTRYQGAERLFIWFLNNGQVTKLNGATHHLTPDLPYPRNAAYETWYGSGITSNEATRLGLRLAFGR